MISREKDKNISIDKFLMGAKILAAIIGPITIITIVVILLWGPHSQGQCISVEGFGVSAKKGDVNCDTGNRNQNSPELTDKPTNPEFIESAVEEQVESQSSDDSSLSSLAGEWYINAYSNTIGSYVGAIRFSDNQFVTQFNQYGQLSIPQYGTYEYDESGNKMTFNFFGGTSQTFDVTNISSNSFTMSNYDSTINFAKV